MKKLLILSALTLLLACGASFCQEKEAVEGKDDIEILATFVRIVALPIDLVGTPLFNLWCEVWTSPARGADLVEYQDKYYYDYGTTKYRETDDKKPAGSRPLGEYKTPDQRPRETKSIMYLPPKR